MSWPCSRGTSSVGTSSLQVGAPPLGQCGYLAGLPSRTLLALRQETAAGLALDGGTVVSVTIPEPLIEALADAIAERVTRHVERRLQEQSPWRTTAEAIEYTRLPASTFEKKVASGEIPAHGVRTHVFHVAELDRALGYAGAGATPIRRRVGAA
jgi:excisionase family DNA binding protein